jgi:polysaccharide biosynthesis/export protein
MTVLDALAQAGGPNENAAPEKIGIYRAGTQRAEIVEFSALIDPARRVNYALEDGDVLFVPTSGLADFGYFMRQISPAISVLGFDWRSMASRKSKGYQGYSARKTSDVSRR